MASLIFTPYISPTSSSSLLAPTAVRIPYASFSISQISYSKNPTSRTITRAPQLGLAQFSPWSGLRQIKVSISQQFVRLERRRKCKGKGVFASLFGVGAPEALVIGVVALLVFGPKGLAEVAKNLGKTLRTFQPTIRELQEVSREFKSTLEKEIGIDELRNPIQGNYTSNVESRSSTPLPTATPENSQATAAAPAVTPEDSQATVMAPAITQEDSQETTDPAATSEDSQPTVDPKNGSPSSKAYSSEEILKVTEEQLKASVLRQQKEHTSSDLSEKPETDV